jgi:phosphoglycolate phosphatase-like HAD superfamily hydrolase
MKNTTIYVLDIDGVICDSAIETGMSGWKAASQIWNDMPADIPEQNLLDQFRCVRPLLETGYEAILIIRSLYLGEKVDTIMADYANKTQTVLESSQRDIKSLKQLFGATRDQWIEDSIEDWIAMNPLFPGIAEKLHGLEKHSVWYIVTTKQERFVKQILAKHQIHIQDDRLFGLERIMSKEDMLIYIMEKHPVNPLVLVEDRLQTLIDVSKNSKLQEVKCLLASWGYNTLEEKQGLQSGPIELIALENFLC